MTADLVELLVCDDCRQAYAGPAYYSVEPFLHGSAGESTADLPCTGSICPDCAGPHLEPDVDGDPRRPTL